MLPFDEESVVFFSIFPWSFHLITSIESKASNECGCE